MRIRDKVFPGCYVELRPTSNGYDVCELRARASLGHGDFRGVSDSVPLLGLREFVDQFERFIDDRALRPKLEGVYDSYLFFYVRGDRVLIEFSVGDATVSPKQFNLTGLLEIDAGQLPSLLTDFKELARAAR